MISLDFPLLPVQHEFITSTARFPALVTGLGYGKTWIGARKAVVKAHEFPGQKGLVAANSYRQLADVVIPELRAALEQMLVPYRWIAKDEKFVLGNGTEILCRSLERTAMNKIRGIPFAWAWLDEARDMTEEAWNVVQGRIGRKRGVAAQAWITTTPIGFNWIYHRWAGSKRKPDYQLFSASTTDNPVLPDEYAETLREAYDDQLAKQELSGEFVDLGKILYAPFDRKLNVSRHAQFDASVPAFLQLDFNVNPCVAALIQEIKGRTMVVAEIFNEDGDATPGVIRRFQERFPGLRPIVGGDPAGHSRDTRSGTSDYELWKQALGKVRIDTGKAAPPIVDRVNATNARICDARGNRRLLVNPECEHTIEDFCQTKPAKDGSRRPRKNDADTPHLTHLTDAVGYYVARHWPVKARVDRLRQAAKDAAGFSGKG